MVTETKPGSEFAIDQTNDPIWKAEIDNFEKEVLAWRAGEGMGAMWSELLMRGSGDLDSRQAADAIDRLGAGRTAEPGTYYMRVGSTLLGERLSDVLPVIVDIVRRPRMDPG